MTTPFDNTQPSLVLNQTIALSGYYPSNGSNPDSASLGVIHTYAFNFTPDGEAATNGQLLNANQYSALYSLLGNTYGGSYGTTFGLPNLQGQLSVGTGQGPGLTNVTIGQTAGTPSYTITRDNLPVMDGGTNAPIQNIQPEVGTQYAICVDGIFPVRDGTGGSTDYLGSIVQFAGARGIASSDGSYMPCDGRVLSISQYQGLFAVIGWTYGGDGRNTFAVPDLRGRDIVGVSAEHQLGSTFGQEQIALTHSQLPNANASPQSVLNEQPGLALNYVIAVNGTYPSRNGIYHDSDGPPVMGEVSAFAGNFAPAGYLLCQGQLLSINQYQALYSLLGTTYGGDGQTTFALPNLSGRSVMGAGTTAYGSFQVGQLLGSETHVLTAAEVPNFIHPVNTVPGAQITDVAGHLVFIGNNDGISVQDADSSVLTTTLDVSRGTLTLSQTTGLQSVSGQGTAHVQLTGSASSINAALNGLSYNSTTGYSGSDAVKIATTDGQFTDTDTVALTVQAAPVNHAPNVVTHTGSVVAGGTIPVTELGDTDPDGDTVATTAGAITGTYGTLTLTADDKYSYVASNTAAINGAATGRHPVDTFTYTASDGHGGTTTETLSITLNRAPLASPDTVTVVIFASSVTTTGNVVANSDTDPDGDAITVTSVAVGTGTATSVSSGTAGTTVHGTYGDLTLHADGSYTYTNGVTSTQKAAIHGAQGTQPADTFTYTESDGHGGNSSTALTVNLTLPTFHLQTADVTYIQGAQAVPLTATSTDPGATFTWYVASSGGTAFSSITPSTIASATYYVSETYAGVESARKAVHVIVMADATPPTLTSTAAVAPATGAASNAGTTAFAVHFSEEVRSVDLADFTLAHTGTAAGTIAAVTDSGNHQDYTIAVSGITGTGTLAVALASSPTVTDRAGNPLAATGLTASTAHVVDRDAPNVISILPDTAGPTNATTLIERVVFSEAVTGVDAADFTVRDASGQVVSGATVGTPISSDGGKSYSVTVSGLTGDGAVHLDLNATGTGIADTAGNSNSGGFTGTSTTLDHTAPEVTLGKIAGDNVVNAAEAQAPITISGTAPGAEDGQVVSVAIDTADGATVLVKATATVTNGAWSLNVPAGLSPQLSDGNYLVTADVSDKAGNPALQASHTMVIDTTADAGSATTLVVKGTADAVINGAEAKAVSFTVAGLDTDASAVATFTDGVHTTTVGVTADGTATVDLSGFNGTVRSSLAITDVHQNTASATGNSVQLDTTAPAAPVIVSFADNTGSTTDTLTRDTTPTLTITAEAGAHVEVFQGGSDVGAATETTAGTFIFTSPALADGTYSFTAVATDPAGNPSRASTAQAITIDATAPAVPVAPVLVTDTGASASDHITSNPAITYATPAFGNSLLYSLDGVTYSATAPSFTVDGTYTVATKEQDAAGNLSAASSLSFTLDTAAPAAPSGLVDAAIKGGFVNAAGNGAGQTLTGAAETGSTVTIYDGQTRLGTTSADAVSGAFSYSLGKLTDGSHSLIATATDAAGNTGPAGVALAFTVDTAGPAAPTVALTNDTGASATDHITSNAGITVAAAESGGSLSYVVDNGPAADTYTAPTAQGSHTVSVTQTDAAGNVSAASSLSFILDTVAPLAPTSNTGTSTNDTTNDPRLAVIPAEAGGSLSYSVDGGAYTTNFDPSSLKDGTHTVAFVQTDTAGNISAADTVTFIVDTTAPKLTLSGVSGQTNQETGHVLSGDLGAGDAGLSVTIRDGSSVLGSTTADAQGHFSFAFADIKSGPVDSYAFTAVATDAAGNVGVSDTLTFSLDYTQNQTLFGTVTHDANSHVGQVFALYEGLFGRAPDQAGAQEWVARLDHGLSLSQVTQGFLDSSEGQSHLNAGNNAAYVEQLYETVLHRQGDTSGAQFWTSFLDHGGSRADAADAFVFSSEHQAQLQGAYSAGVYLADPTDAAVARLYYGLPDRAPDADGLQTWESAAHNGVSLTSIAQAFLTSAEYGLSHPVAQTDRQFVDALYKGALGRAAESAGEQSWLDALTHGSSRADVAVAIAESPEAQQHLASQIEQGWHLV